MYLLNNPGNTLQEITPRNNRQCKIYKGDNPQYLFMGDNLMYITELKSTFMLP